MRILILNWRDIKDPKAGGAELLTQEVAKRLVQRGHSVVQYNSRYRGAKNTEVIDGVHIIRHGNYITTYIYSFLTVLFKKEHYDLIIDEIHGIPYFTPLITKKKIVAFALEVARHHWSLLYPFPINLVGRILEKLYFLIYRWRKIQFITISPSSKSALIKQGVSSDLITVIPMGLSVVYPKKNYPKKNYPLLIFIGRLSPIKGIEDALWAFTKIKQKKLQAKLWIIGTGEKHYVDKLVQMTRSLQISRSVIFFGYVSNGYKFRLLQQAHILLVPSKNEGWGLIVPEAGVVGTPAVVYNVVGLKDVVKNKINGLITKENSPDSLAESALYLLDTPKLYQKLQSNAVTIAKGMDWDNTVKAFLKVLEA